MIQKCLTIGLDDYPGDDLFRILKYRRFDDYPLLSFAFTTKYKGDFYLWCVNRHVLAGVNLTEALKYSPRKDLSFFKNNGVYEVDFRRNTRNEYTAERKDDSCIIRFTELNDMLRSNARKNIPHTFGYIKQAIRTLEYKDFFGVEDIRSEYLLKALSYPKCELVNLALLGTDSDICSSPYWVYPDKEFTVFSTCLLGGKSHDNPRCIYLVRAYENGMANAIETSEQLGYTMPTSKAKERETCQKTKTKKK